MIWFIIILKHYIFLEDADISVMNIDAVPALDYHLHLNINGDILTANYIDADSTNGVLTAAHNFNLSYMVLNTNQN